MKNSKKPSSKRPLFSIVIVNWNKKEDTLFCIEHVRKLDYPNFEIIVVDNGSIDGSNKMLKDIDDIKYVRLDTNTGFTGGHIAGLNASSGEYIVLLNNDAVIKHDYLNIALKHFEDSSDIGAVGGRAYWWDEENPVLSEKGPYYSYQSINPITAEAITHQDDGGVHHEVNNVSGSCAVVSREAVEKVGYLYDDFFAYYEETDLFARMKRAGLKVVYDPKLSIWHKNGASSTPYFQYKQLFKNRFLFAVRNFDSFHLKKFLKNYTKTGLKSLVYSLKRTEFSALHKGFRDGFIHNLIHFPSAFRSRSALQKELDPSNYNQKLYSENSLVSFVVSVSSNSVSENWIDYANKNELIEFMFVSKNPIKNTLPANCKVVSDISLFDTYSENIGWLSSKNQYVIFSSLESKPLSKSDIEKALWQAKTKNLWVASVENDSQNLMLDRELLIKHGGLDKFESDDILSAIKSLVEYSYARRKKSVERYVLNQLKISNTTLSSEKLHERILFDKRSEAKPSKWIIFINRHYRIYQIRNYFRWLFSFKISLRLKLARTKNLVMSVITLNRRRFATELKHIRNEVIKSTPGFFNITQQGEKIKNRIPDLKRDWQNIPIFIICRDRLDPLQKLLKRLDEFGMKKIIIIDNDSIYPPLVNFYRTLKNIQVIRTGANIGHTVPWEGSFIKTLVPNDFYIVSDPDVIPTEKCPNDVVKYFLDLHEKYPLYQKIGFGLKIDDLPNEYALKKSVIEWESQFWKQELEINVFEAAVDTTFALYKPYTFSYLLSPSIRTGDPYLARHLPWYVSSKKLSGEENFYRDRANSKITSWNLDDLPERYKKEMEKS
jgi:GT2 family glycosyltransferase